MSLKRKCDFDQFDSSSSTTSLCAGDGPTTMSSMTTAKHIKTEQLLNRLSSKTIVNIHNSPSHDHNDKYNLIELLILTDANTSNSSPVSNNQESNGDQIESNTRHDESITPTSPSTNNNNSIIQNNETNSTSTTPAIESHSNTKEIPSGANQPQRKRRKNVPSSKISRPSIPSSSSSIIPNNIKIEKNVHQLSSIPTNTSSSSPAATTTNTTTTVKGNTTMIFNLIRSLLEEKQLDNNDENLISTIDCLIDSLQHLRERIKITDTTADDNSDERNSSTRNNHHYHDDSSPLNLSKPKIRHQARVASTNSDD
ncbi:unnamed protein product, partial [Rotaria magnacalcarata]